MSKSIVRQTILERVTEMTRHAREREAEKLFTLEAVRRKISDAAGEGFNRMAVGPDKPIDLSQADTTKATVATLMEEGFTVEWDVRLHADGQATKIMVVRW